MKKALKHAIRLLREEEERADHKTENSSEIPNNCEPQTNADQHVQRVEYIGNDEKSRCWTCKHFERMHETPIASDGNYYTYVVCTAKECHYEPQTEPQYDAEEVAKDINRRVDMVKKEWNARHIEDEPQTDIHGLTDCDFCKGKNCEDCEGGKDEPQTEAFEEPNYYDPALWE